MAISDDPMVPPATELDARVREAFGLAPGPDSTCFLCGDVVAHPAIYWAGESNIWLHPDCALALIGGLTADLRRLRELERLRERLSERRGK